MKSRTKKKIWRWLGIVVGVFTAIVIGAWWLVNTLAQREFDKRYEVNVTLSVPPPTDVGAVEEGRRLARLTGCTHCHGENLAGGLVLDTPHFARVVAPNITTLLPAYTDAQLVALLRRGVKRDGASAWFMPAEMYRHLHDDDIAGIIAWIRLMPKNDAIMEATDIRPLGKLAIARGEVRSSADEVLRLGRGGDARVPPGRGAYLVTGLCSECHGQDLDGRVAANVPSLTLTKGYTPRQFATLMRDGIGPDGRRFALMTATAKARFTYLSDDEIAAMFEFLRTR